MQNKSECTANVHLYVNENKKTKPTKDLFGIFFEDLNHAADGGLYAEMLRNRDFEFTKEDNKNYTSLTAWNEVGDENDVTLKIIEEKTDKKQMHHYLNMEVRTAGCGVENTGYNSGLFLQEGKEYRFTCIAKCNTEKQLDLSVELCDKFGNIVAKQELPLCNHFEKHEVRLTPATTDTDGILRLTLQKVGEVLIDYVSLFPIETFMNRENGIRNDLASALADMKPKFMRFPGGCLVHCGSTDAEERKSMYRWKKTIGDVEKRSPKSSSWGYHQTLGLGFFEFFQFCEDIGTKPLPVIAAGYDPHTRIGVPLNQMQEWIDEALDLIEFANGDSNTYWGNIRSNMGHPESFNLEYLAIGNEEQGEGFFERYEIMHNAVREKYPEIKLINSAGPWCAGGDFETGWKSAIKMKSDCIDEHYYQAPEWFIANHHRYDNNDPNGPKVFLGEYASEGNTWFNALTEASYMIGLERNCDKVALACYAPMLANNDYVNWRAANMIYYDNHQLMLTPNYYVQKLFMVNQGDSLLESRMETEVATENWTSGEDFTIGGVSLRSNRAIVEYTDIRIETPDGKMLVSKESCIIQGGLKEIELGEVREKAYSISFKAQQLGKQGAGFNVDFGKQENGDHLSVNLGGWNADNNALNEYIDGKQIVISQYPFPLEINREYKVKIDVDGRKIKVTIDDVVYQDVERQQIIVEPLYCSSTIEEATGDIIVKVVNVRKQEQSFQAILQNSQTREYVAYRMSGYEREDTNELGKTEKVKPVEEKGIAVDGKLQYTIPPEAFIVFRLINNN